MYFVCSQAGALGVIVEKKPTEYKAGETFKGSEIGGDGLQLTGLPDRL